MSPDRSPQFVTVEIARQLLGRASVPPDWNLATEEFRVTLQRSASRRFCNSPPQPKDLESYFETLHVLDLALACACSAGTAAAWDFFVAQFRPELYRAARAVAGESSGRELADSLYAELYGLRESEGERKSLFDYFHGRSKLTTWLRAILSQRYVDEIRRLRRTEPLEDRDGEDSSETVAARNGAADGLLDPERRKYLAILQATLTLALDALAPRDRLRLAYYYVDELTLAEIGKLLGEHEATVSRKLERTRKDLRGRIDAALRERKLSDAQLRLCYEYAREEWPFDLTLRLRPISPRSADSGPAV